MQETDTHPSETQRRPFDNGRADTAVNTEASSLPAGARVLLAESDDVSRQRMKGILEDRGYHVISVADGFELICRIPEWRPDILLASAQLARLTGPQVCALLQQCPDYRELPVFILKHNQSDSERQVFEMESCGAAGMLSSPFSTEELSSLLATRVTV
jgi:twitching motility two-component system response regulator PilG